MPAGPAPPRSAPKRLTQADPHWGDAQEESRAAGLCAGGHPRNPLGVRALYLGSSTYCIHGTDAPWTVGQDVSRGCIRMFNDDVIDLYQRVPIGTQVLVTW